MFAIDAPFATATATPHLRMPTPWVPTLLLAGALVLGTAAWDRLRGAGSAPSLPAASSISAWAARPAATDDALAALRQAAAVGNVDASAALVGALLDRYEAGAGTAALFEALQWLQRDLDTVPMLASGQVQRVVLGACRHDPLLQWHWLCNEGE